MVERDVLVRVIGAAIALRSLLILLGVGRFLEWRYEVSTTINSSQTIRECLHLWDHGVSPYTSSACNAPPLLLWALGGFMRSPSVSCTPGILCDALAGLLLRDIQAAAASGLGPLSCSPGASSDNKAVVTGRTFPCELIAC